MLKSVYKMQNEELITVVDAATISWLESPDLGRKITA